MGRRPVPAARRRTAGIGGWQPAAGDNQVLPVLWSDDDLTLGPGESQTITATYARAALQGASAVVSLSGWNAAVQTIAAPER